MGLYARDQGLIEPRDNAAVRVVIQKPIRGHQGKRIPSWMSKHPVFCSMLKRLHDDQSVLFSVPC